MGLQNVNFATTGAGRGFASAWQIAALAQGSDQAGFRAADTDPTDPSFADPLGWTAAGVSVANSGTGPNGEARRLVTETAGTTHRLTSTNQTLAAGNHTLGAYFSLGTGRHIAIEIVPPSTTVVAAVFDLQTGRVAFMTGPSVDVTALNAQIVGIGGGWFRCELTVTIPTSISVASRWTMSNGDFSSSTSWYTYASTGATVFGTEAAFSRGGDLRGTDDLDHAWGVDGFALHLVIPSTALSDFAWTSPLVTPPLFEEFDTGWSNTPLLLTVVPGHQAIFVDSFGGHAPPEGFDSGWSNDPMWTSLPSSSGMDFNTSLDGFENFDVEWLTDPYQTTIATASHLLFNQDIDGQWELFSPFYRDSHPSITLSLGVSIFTDLAHGFDVGIPIFAHVFGGDFPAPLNQSLQYWVHTVPTVDTYTISLTSGGSPIATTTPGSGDLFFRADPTRCWNELDANDYFD